MRQTVFGLPFFKKRKFVYLRYKYHRLDKFFLIKIIFIKYQYGNIEFPKAG